MSFSVATLKLKRRNESVSCPSLKQASAWEYGWNIKSVQSVNANPRQYPVEFTVACAFAATKTIQIGALFDPGGL